ncbi:MAG: saccharopine dehydrogenase, partial [Desertifilum sp. SIO1I2]|nr:saccharopine dehydrogenase [Desertifilum sp. SIO1I2]
VVTGRQLPHHEVDSRFSFLLLNLADLEALDKAISEASVVVHCAGPFHYRDARVLKTCIEHRVNYVDVSDHRSFTQKAIAFQEPAKRAGVTAVINSGIFPGISNSMVRQGVEQFDTPEKIHLSYVVSGSGGAGLTVMRTTFLGLQQPFKVWIDGEWQKIQPYSDREIIQFPPPYGKTGVYWFDMPEAFTFVDSFGVKTVITKFGSIPDFYNLLTAFVAHRWPESWLRNPSVIEFLANVSYKMTNVSDRFSGIGVAIRSVVTGQKDGKTLDYCSTLVHENTAIAAGYGTGSIAQQLLSGELKKPGVWPVEQVLTTELFEQAMQSRNLKIEQQWVESTAKS